MIPISAFQKLKLVVGGIVQPRFRRIGAWFWALPASVWIWSARLAWGSTLVFLALIALVQWMFVARLHHYQPEIEAHASALLGQSVRIGHLQGHWRGLNPGIVLDRLDLVDAQGKPSLSLKQVAVFLSWKSILQGQPVVDLLLVDSPVLHIRRSDQGKITVAGFGADGEANPESMKKLLGLRQLRIQHAEIIWDDQLKKAPPLVLHEVNFGLDNLRYLGQVHRFGLTASPPKHLASRLDIRGEWGGAWEGGIEQGLESIWSGRLFAELISADLAAWQPWLGYQSVLSQGQGGVRLWASQLDKNPSATLDLGLVDVRVRPGRDISGLDVGQLSGRFQFSGSLSDKNRQLIVLSDNVKAQSVKINWPDFFPAAPVLMSEAESQFSFKGDSEGWSLSLKQLAFANSDVAGVLWGSYSHSVEGPKRIDLQGDFSRAEASAVWRYLPSVIGIETRHWLRAALQAGKGSEGKLVLQGDLRKFPFHTSQDGIFRVSAKVQDATLQFAKTWPSLVNINGDLSFEQLGMRISAHDARLAGKELSGVVLGPVDVFMPDLETLDEQLQIQGVAQGETSGFLSFVELSPVGGFIGHATRDIRAKGEGKLELGLNLPIRRMKDVQLNGTYHVQHNEVTPIPVLPPVQQVSGKIIFSDKEINIPDLNGMWLGHAANFKGGGRSALSFTANGGLAIKDYRATLPADHVFQPFLAGLSGSTQWKADIRVPQGKSPNWQVNTDLVGIASSLPGPLNKSATRKVPTSVVVVPIAVSNSGGNKLSQREQWQLRSEGLLSGLLQFKTDFSPWQFEKGAIALGNASIKLPESGLALAMKWPEFRLEEWQSLLDDKAEKSGNEQGLKASALMLPMPSQFSLETDHLFAFGRQIDKVSIQGSALRGLEKNALTQTWQLAVNAEDLNGAVQWMPEGRGSIRADLKRLHLSKLVTEQNAENGSLPKNASYGANASNLTSTNYESLGAKALPALDIRVADFSLGDLRLGRLELQAENEGYRWKIPQLIIANADGKFTGYGVWEMARGSGKLAVRDSTQLNFKLDTQDLGKFLDRLDYRDLVRKGRGVMSGNVNWAGRPTSLDYASLNGTVQVRAEDGQFAKIESGTGKLIGLLSLQALPRRLLLDFNDVFNEGFSFDKISGDFQVSKGILRAQEPILVEGASAQILLQGETDLAQETQDLHILVRPRFGGVASLGAAVAVNPVVGLASLVAQKVLRDPLDRILSYQYHVTGSWADPHVIKD